MNEAWVNFMLIGRPPEIPWDAKHATGGLVIGLVCICVNPASVFRAPPLISGQLGRYAE